MHAAAHNTISIYRPVKGLFYRGAHRGYRNQERSFRKQAAADALILLGVVTCTVLTGLLAVMLAKGW